jgi:hypothetical protein
MLGQRMLVLRMLESLMPARRMPKSLMLDQQKLAQKRQRRQMPVVLRQRRQSSVARTLVLKRQWQRMPES